MAQHLIGLDVGSWSIKACTVTSTLRGFALTDFVEHHIPRDVDGAPVDADRAAAVRATLEGLTERDSIQTALSGRRVLVREVALPFSDDKRIESVLPFQLDDLLPRDLDEMVFDWYRIEEDEEGVRLLCPAASRAEVEGYLAELEAAQADPRSVTLDSLALGSLGEHLYDEPPEAPVAFVDIGHTTTTVTVLQGERVRTIRTLARGGHQVTLALKEALGLEYGQAEQLKHALVRLDDRAAEDADPQLFTLCQGTTRQALAPLLREIRLTLHRESQRWGTPVERIHLSGGSSRMPGLDTTVATELGVPVSPTGLAGRPWMQLDAEREELLSMPLAASLALLPLGAARRPPVELRQGDLAFESDFKAVRDRMGWMMLMAAAILCAFFAHKYLTLQVLEDNHETLVAQLRDFSTEVLGEEKEDFDFVRQRLAMPPESDFQDIFPKKTALKSFWEITAAQDAVNQTLRAGAEPLPELPEGAEGEGGEAGARPPGPRDDPPPGAEGEGDEAAEELDDGKHKVELKQVQVSLKNAFLKGEANDIEAIEAFTSELKEIPCFFEVETNDTTRISFGGRQDWLRFQLRIEIDCVQQEEADKEKAEKARKAKAKDDEAADEGEATDEEGSQ